MTRKSGDLKTHARSVLGLSKAEVEELVSAVGSDALSEFVTIMEKLIIAERIPVVIRRRGDGWLNGRSLLEVLRTEGIESIRRYIDRLRSYVPE
jgi:hypothetical protein